MESQGAGFTVYHLHFNGEIGNSLFVGNVNESAEPGCCIYFHLDRDKLKVIDCMFDRSHEDAIRAGSTLPTLTRTFSMQVMKFNGIMSFSANVEINCLN